MGGVHAILSPSGADRWMTCVASSIVSDGIEDEGSEFASEGTAAHTLGSWALAQNTSTDDFIGQVIKVGLREFMVDEEMADYVQQYVDKVRELTGPDGVAFYEQAVPLVRWTQEQGAEGTSDAVIIRGTEICIVDLKFGRGVRVDAKDNKQLMLYALGARDKFSEFCDEITSVRVCISQPRNGGFSEWSLSVHDLLVFGQEVRDVARTTVIAREHKANWINDPHCGYYVPSEKACMWCRYKPNCAALAKHVEEVVGASFEDLTDVTAPPGAAPAKQITGETPVDQLQLKLEAVGLIEDWIKALRAEVERRLFQGTPVPGFKLVQGKQGNRAWSSAEEAEAALKAARLKSDEMYDKTIISPTTAEKRLAKDKPRVWSKLQALITRSEGKASVAPESDKRPALVLVATADGFTNLADDPSA